MTLRSVAAVLACPTVLLAAANATAQSPPAQQPQRAGQAAKPAAGVNKGQAPAAQSEAAQLRSRVEQLEEQLVDLQVVIGTLESLARPPAAAGGAGQSADAARLQSLEAQLKSLAGQIEQLGEKVRSAGEPSRRSETYQPAPTSTAAQAPDMPDDGVRPGQQLAPLGSEPAGVDRAPRTASIGSSTVDSSQPEGPQAPAAVASPGGEVAAIDQGGGDPKQDYEVAYSYVIQRDYGAAQAGFTDFLKRYPKDSLVPNALYWLGETHYQQRNFADAAEAFDLVTKMYASSPKAADSLLKRALSLSALGKNSEACSALSNLDRSFQNAPAYVKTRAGSERRRLGCS